MTTGTHCQQCGAPVEAGALFCSKCGIDVSGVQPVEAATVEMPATGLPPSHVRATMRQTLRDATLGEYEILNELGRGGMATVFLAHDISLDRKVAIKVMAPHLLEGEGMTERFKLEARTAAQLSHPHIIPIYAVRETETTLYFIMKYIEGRGLDEIIKKTAPLPIPMVKDILTKVGAALGYAHRRDVVHRDVKPGNIMIDEEGTPIVTDFGIAKVAEAQGLTMTGATIGTPAYMSPEQCEAKQVTGASDQYSLGVVVFEMLTGKVPFVGDTAVSTMYKHCHEPLPLLEDFRPDCPPELRDTVTRMLAKDPADRWPSLEATIKKLGTGTDPYLDPIRSHLLELARDGDAGELLAQLSTPGTPLPGLTTGPRAAGGAAIRAEAAGVASVGRPSAPRKRVILTAAIVGLSVIGAGAVALTRPWGADEAALVQNPAGGAEPDGALEGGSTADGSETGGSETGGAETGGAPGEDGGGGGGAQGNAAAAAGPPTDTLEDATVPTLPPAARGQPAAVRSVRVDNLPTAMEVGHTVRLDATALNASGAAVDRGSVRWSVSDESVGRITGDGTFTARAPGSVDVTATVGAVVGRGATSVRPASVASVVVSPSTLALTVGERGRVVADVRDRTGNAVGDVPVRWTSGDVTVATVSADGEVIAVSGGRTRLTAAVGEVDASVGVSVEAAPVDARTAIDDLIAAYARALESGDIGEVRRVNTGMTEQEARQTGSALQYMQDLAVDLRVESFEDHGDTATANVVGTYRFVTADSGRRQELPVRFAANFQRSPAGWRMTGTR